MADVRGRGVASPPFSSPTLADKLRIASSKGQLDKVQLLLEASAGFLPDKENYEDGRLPLHYAAAEGYTEVCRVLINHGADMNSQDSEGNTALHLATKNGYSRTVELLAKSHCNLFICNKWRCTALHLAAESGHNQTARVLLYAGINPDIPNEYGDSALITACRYGHAGVTRILLSANCKVNHQNNHGDTALHISAATHKRKITKLLLEGGINTSISNSANETAAAIAKRKNYPEVLWLIASHPAPPQPAPQHHHHHMKDQLDFHPEGPTVVPEGDLPGKLASTQQPPKKEKKFLFFKKKKSKKEKAAEEVKLQVSSKPRAGHHHRPSVQGLFSQYINKPGYQYYRDLAGNIKQGPVGYAPSCQCKPALKKLEDRLESNRDQLYQHFDASQQVLRERLEQLDQRTTQQVNALDKRTQERFESEQTHCRDRILHYLGQERDQFSQRLDAHGAEVRTELRDWVETRLQDTFREPVNKPQDDSGLYQRDIFTGATPHVEGRLYRTRSDETLSQSDYSVKKKKYHFYESRQAAMQSLRAWKVQGYSRENRADRQPLSLHQSSQNVQRIQNSEARERSRSSYQLAEEHPQRQSANGNRCKSSYDLVANKPVKQVVQADIHKSFDYMDSRTIPHSSSYPTRPAGSQPSVYHASDYAKSSQGGLSQYHGAISKQTEQRDHSMSPERPSVFSRLEPSPIAYCPQRPSVAQTSSAQSTSGQLYPSSSYTPHYTTSLTNRDYQPHAALKPVTEDASKPPSSASGLTMYNNYGKLNLISEDRVSGTQYRPTNTDTSSKQFSVLQPGPVSYNRASERGSTSDSPRSQTHSSHYSGSAGEATPQTSAPNPVYATQPSSVSRVWARPQDYELRGVRPSQPPVPQPKPDLIYMRSAQTYRSDQPNPPGPDRPNPDVVYQVRAAYQTSPQNTQPLYHGLGKDDSGSNPDSGYSSRIYGTRLQSATPSPRNTSSFQLDPNSSSRWTPSSTSSAEHNLSESPVPRASPYSQAQSPPHHYTTSPTPIPNPNQRQEALRHVASHIQSWYQRQQYQYPGEDNSTRLNKPPQAQKYTNNNSQPYSNSGGNGNKESYSSLQGSDV